MSELDGLEEIDLGAHRSAGSAKRIRNGRKQMRKRIGQGRDWKKVLRCYETRKAKVEK